MCVQLMQDCMKLFSTAAKLFAWCLRLRVQKHGHPVADTGCTESKICFLLQKFWDRIRYWALRWQRHSETNAISIWSSEKACELVFPDVRPQWKMYSFVPSVGPCMHHNYWCDFRKAYIPDCVRPTTLVAGLCTTCHGERVLVVIKFNVTFLPLTPYWKNVYLFLERCKQSNNVWSRALLQSDCLYHH